MAIERWPSMLAPASAAPGLARWDHMQEQSWLLKLFAFVMVVAISYAIQGRVPLRTKAETTSS